MNKSPWIEQLHRTRPERLLEENISTDIAIIGGGISGIMTAYFTLRYTEKRVVVIEGGLVGHGATGHNAGQIVSDFDRPFREMVAQFGLEATSSAVSAIEGTWETLEELMHQTNLQVPISYSTGYIGYSTVEQIKAELENFYWRKQGGLPVETLLIANESKEALQGLNPAYQAFVSYIPNKDIWSLLETNDEQYIAVHSSKRACVNSALLTESLAGYLLQTYPERFSLFEKTMVEMIDLGSRSAAISIIGGKEVKSRRVVLCTNGFEQLHI
ncbi:FAD-binding oxidoreductase, partial [Candidatus Uhrbacteria bacterium]|nr:FAD-binding oxidoreductase [Candidatus Uhrbacteria bacterium]